MSDIGVSSTNVDCMFCQQRKPRAREDIISNWISNELGGEPPFYLELRSGQPGQLGLSRSRVGGSLAMVKLANVCVDCNTGWMSRSEDAAKRILLPMMRGQRVRLSPSEQRILSAWSQLKCICLDAWYGAQYNERNYLPSTAVAELINYLPLPGCEVALGEIEPLPRGSAVPFGRLPFEIDPQEIGGASGYLIRTTIALGCCCVQVGVGWIEPPGVWCRIDDKHLPPSLVRIWPFIVWNGIEWPPPIKINQDEALNLHRRGGLDQS
jgi:hypothetical protein